MNLDGLKLDGKKYLALEKLTLLKPSDVDGQSFVQLLVQTPEWKSGECYVSKVARSSTTDGCDDVVWVWDQLREISAKTNGIDYLAQSDWLYIEALLSDGFSVLCPRDVGLLLRSIREAAEEKDLEIPLLRPASNRELIKHRRKSELRKKHLDNSLRIAELEQLGMSKNKAYDKVANERGLAKDTVRRSHERLVKDSPLIKPMITSIVKGRLSNK